ncbi:FAD-dependent oxidoreductase [Pseudonocardia sp. KRD291]|uniref:FAD-dependent oxidoreductase n=1 Tax=Pseudonocardia sp. KRD291 TaxID=2792007 RepID=UPI001C4A334F|nr:FAD-dependent oxidoreductase [Pseudonocardia sp. KRD291]MBW0101505.1 FAD-dependent oxidoreductase [Pseudonocardia sp. KRD291]
MVERELPVVVIGAGPVGLAAAAELLARGLEPLVLEAGDSAGSSVRQWGHVRLFSPWEWVIDPAAQRLLEPTGWGAPDLGAYPTGAEWVAGYLAPLGDVLGERVRTGARVVGVARRGRDRVVDAGRGSEPLVVHIDTGAGEERLAARAVIDASGTWTSANPLGGDGLPAIGERAAGQRVRAGVPDLTDPAERSRYAGRHVAVAGSGHSALTALASFADLVRDEPGTRVSWLLRRGGFGQVFGGGDADQLPARGALGQRAEQAVAAGLVTPVFGFRTERVDSEAGGTAWTLVSDDGQRVEGVEEVVVLTGFRPELDWLSEVRLDLDPTLQAPTRLAPLIDPNVHSCGTVYPHGAAELAQPEPGVYLAGMKSYGRAPTFLARTGYEQVRSIAAELAGDHEAAARVELVLNETGVCGGAGLFDEDTSAAETEAGSGCCATPSEPATAGAPAAGA